MRMLFPKGFNQRGNSPLGVCTLLPPEVRKELMAATTADLEEREMCIDRAVARAKRKHPQFFQP